MLHPTLPQSMTIENLAAWLQENQVDKIHHVEQIPLTAEEISEFEHKSSIASRSMDGLKGLLKVITETMKKGTPVNADGDPQPVNFTVPPTVGLETLEDKRKVADQTILQGYRNEITHLYCIQKRTRCVSLILKEIILRTTTRI